MTANQGPGVPVDLLRERLAKAVCAWYAEPPDTWDEPEYFGIADAVLTEIASSGMVIIAGDRLERLNDVGTHALAYWEYRFANVVASDRVRDLPDKERLLGLACMLLEPGDLDGVGTGGEGRS